MFGISGEHLLILGIVLLIFGPRRLPELGNTLGKAIRNFKDSINGVEEAKYRHLKETLDAVPGADAAKKSTETASASPAGPDASGSSGTSKPPGSSHSEG